MQEKIDAGQWRNHENQGDLDIVLYLVAALIFGVCLGLLAKAYINLRDKLEDIELALKEDHVPELVECLEFAYDREEDKSSIWARNAARVLRKCGSPIYYLSIADREREESR